MTKTYTVTQAAAVLGVTRGLVLRWIHAKRIRAARVGSQWTIRPTDLERFRRIPRSVGCPPGYRHKRR